MNPIRRRAASGFVGVDSIPTAISLVLMGLGVMVIGGWIFHVSLFTQIFPGFASMTTSTAICLALMGLALFLSRGPDPTGRRAPRMLAGSVLVIATLNLMQIASKASVGLNFAALHQWMRDGNPVPGQMSTPTSIALVLAAFSFLVTHTARLRATVFWRLARIATTVIMAIAAVALVGYLLQFEALYSWYAFSRMAIHTACAMALLAVALWLQQSRMEGNPKPGVEDRIVVIGTWTLVLVALVAGLTGVAVLRKEADRELANGLRQTHRARMELLTTILEMSTLRADMAASRPGIRGLLKSLSVSAASGTTPVNSEALDRLHGFGFSSVRLISRDGVVLASSGQVAEDAWMEVRILPDQPGETRLAWNNGFVLTRSVQVRDENGWVGSIATEQPLMQIDLVLKGAVADGGDSETEICGTASSGLACFPNRSNPIPYIPVVPARADRAALLEAAGGADGTDSFRTESSGREFSAYGPVGITGLIAATSRDNDALFAPLRRQLSLGILLVILVTLAGSVVLRGTIRPLARALAVAERRYRVVVDNIQEGVLLQDEKSAVLAANPAASRIFGVPLADLQGMVAGDPRWQVFDEDGKPCPREDYPTPKAIRLRCSAQDVPYGVLDGHGQLRWIEVSTTYVPTLNEPIVVTTFSDITEKRLASQRLDQSESRFQLMVNHVVDYAILMLDMDGRVTSWNLGAERNHGYGAAEIIGSHFSVFFTDEDRATDAPAQALRETDLQGRFECDSWRTRKDGSRFWCHVVLTPVRDARGRQLGYSKVTRDLTAQREASMAATEAWRRMQAMIDSSPFGIVSIDLQGLICNMNPAGQRMTGYTSEELVGKLTCAVYHDMDEIRERARMLSEQTGRHIEPGLETFVHKARLGQSDEQEWICVRKDGHRFPIQATITALRDPAGEIVGFMGVGYDITERKQREASTRHAAHHDFLTGLPTRRLMSDRVQSAIDAARRDSRKVGLLMIDLDHFKRINDSLGHPVGDELLQVVAQRLVGSVRSDDTVARMGGDEFLVVLPNLENSAAAERLADRLVKQISLPIAVGSHELHVSPSVGISVYPDDSNEMTGLLKDADAAMYAAKLAGRACYRSYSSRMRQDADEELQLENDLRTAIRNGELDVHYQHQISLGTGDMIGMEALLRWTHPQRGPVPPLNVIAIAERSGLIVPLGEWVLRTACMAALRIQQRTGVPLRLAVNLSPHQFRSPGLPALVAATLEETGLDARHLELEITEGTLMEDVINAIDRFRTLRKTGVQIAVDDFGTGHSSLSYITRFSLDTIKIDRSFVQRLPAHSGDAAVVQSIVSLSRNLGIRVVLEGVEHANQLGFLRSRNYGVNETPQRASKLDRSLSVQGYYFGTPLSEHDFTRTFEAFQKESRAQVEAIAA